MLTAPRRLPPAGPRIDQAPHPYPSPRAQLDDVRHRNELARVLEDGIVSDTELAEARDYLNSVRSWAAQVAAEQPGEPAEAARRLLGQATLYSAAVQEADGFIQVSLAIEQNDPRPINALLRRGYDDAAYGSALSFAGRALNPLIDQMALSDRAAMAGVLSRVPRLGNLNDRSVEQLRASLTAPSVVTGFNQRYPRSMPFQGSILV